MKRMIVCALILALFNAPCAFAQGEVEEVAPPPEGMENNLGSLSASDNVAAVNIAEGEVAAASGTIDGEITLHKVSNGIEVFSGALNIAVEKIPDDADGQTGNIVANGANYIYNLSGRPPLHCPAQDISDWYGPCKVSESNS